MAQLADEICIKVDENGVQPYHFQSLRSVRAETKRKPTKCLITPLLEKKKTV